MRSNQKTKYVSYDFIVLNYIFGVPVEKHLNSIKVICKTNKINVLINEHGILGSGKDIEKIQTLLAQSVILN